MVATDLAARGLDLPAVRAVVNFEPARTEEDYVHRIGRTARAGAQGDAYSFLFPNDAGGALAILQVLRRSTCSVPPELEALAAPGPAGRGAGWTRF